MKLYYIVFYIIFLSGCTYKNLNSEQKKSLAEINKVAQDVSVYSLDINKSFISTLERFEKNYFKPWRIEKIDISKDEAMWAYRVFNSHNSYGDNLQKIPQVFFTHILYNSNFEAFSTVNQRAITLTELNIRAFPTQKPLLRNPKLAGEGFPFDYLQNSSIAANKPIFVSHYSKDKQWAFIESSFTYGWVESRNIALMKKKYTDLWQKAHQIFFLKDNISVISDKDNFLFKSKIGLMLPQIDESNSTYKILAIGNYKNSKPLYLGCQISKEVAHKGILEFNSKNINSILNEISKVNYGWGGIYGERDCSSTLRDFFAPFGIWLPRNSYQQSRIGKVISLEKLSNKEKIETIKKYGVAFETLLYKKGHIVLYVGTHNNKIIIFHNTWGIKTKNNGIEGRYIVGKPIFSTLTLGDELENFDENASILKGLKSMNIVTY